VDLKEIEWVVVDWIGLAKVRPVVAVSYGQGNEPSGFIECGEFFSLGPVSFTRRTLLYES
jgi:hypothetical protein